MNLTLVAQCTGEVMLVTGNLHVVATIWNDSDRLRVQSHINENLAAWGLTSGLTYRVQQITNETFELDWGTGAAEADAVFHFNVISATTVPNFFLTMNGTWHWDPDGTVTFEPKRWEILCR